MKTMSLSFKEIMDKAYCLYTCEEVPDEYSLMLLDLVSWANVRYLAQVRREQGECLKSEDVPF